MTSELHTFHTDRSISLHSTGDIELLHMVWPFLLGTNLRSMAAINSLSCAALAFSLCQQGLITAEAYVLSWDRTCGIICALPPDSMHDMEVAARLTFLGAPASFTVLGFLAAALGFIAFLGAAASLGAAAFLAGVAAAYDTSPYGTMAGHAAFLRGACDCLEHAGKAM